MYVVLQIPMQYVQVNNFAPYAIRKAASAYVGGLDETMADKGDFKCMEQSGIHGYVVCAPS